MPPSLAFSPLVELFREPKVHDFDRGDVVLVTQKEILELLRGVRRGRGVSPGTAGLRTEGCVEYPDRQSAGSLRGQLGSGGLTFRLGL